MMKDNFKRFAKERARAVQTAFQLTVSFKREVVRKLFPKKERKQRK